ncbi:MAG: FecR family protein [Azonexus sp.]|nr:FecR family protein [Azonexus sp.]
MTHQYPVKLKAAWLALSVTLFYPLAVQAAGSARIDFAIGGVVASTATGSQRTLAKGAEVVSGETIRTAADGRAQLRFDDGAMVSLQPGTEFRLDNYHFSGKQDGQERGFFSLLKGGLRTITGLIGRNNRDAYKVTTTVATIGIRGTEYTIAYTGADSVAIATGEGAIEVCSQSGCGVLAGGESGEVKGAAGSLQRTDFRPLLSPAQPNDLLLANFSTSESRNADGSVQLNAGQLVSGGGYSLSWARDSLTGSATDGTAEFGDSSQLLYASNASGYFKGGVLGESGVSDGVIGWGRWVTATDQLGSNLNNFHYVIGRETVGFAGITATYNLIGSTNPTSTNGNVGSALTGSLVATLNGGLTSLQLSMNVPINATVYNVQGSSSTSTASFSFASLNGVNVYGGDAKGAFYGVGASHAGVSYKFETSMYDWVSGAAAFKR